MNNIYLEPAGLIKRFIAFVIDMWPLILATVIMISGAAKILLPITALLIILSPIIIIFSFLYFPSSFRQATLGQRLMNIYVVCLNKAKIDAGFALMRFLVWLLLPSIIEGVLIEITSDFLSELNLKAMSVVFFITWYLIPPVISDKNQAIHDMLLKTVVVNGRLEKN